MEIIMLLWNNFTAAFVISDFLLILNKVLFSSKPHTFFTNKSRLKPDILLLNFPVESHIFLSNLYACPTSEFPILSKLPSPLLSKINQHPCSTKSSLLRYLLKNIRQLSLLQLSQLINSSTSPFDHSSF